MTKKRPNPITVGNRKVGDGQTTYVILEAGSNWLDLGHADDLDYGLEQAKQMIQVAKEVGADAVKFQIFRAKDHISSKAVTPPYLKKTTAKSLYDIIHDLELPRQWIKELDTYAHKCKIDFLTSPCDREAVEQLLRETHPPAFKVASYDIVDLDFLNFLAKTKKPLILSTGMATEEEILEALESIAKAGNDQVCLFHCISSYPAPLDQLYLRTIQALKRLTNVPIGFSDHTLETWTPSIAVAAGACAIEKHFTLDRKQKGPDHVFALMPEEAREMTDRIRATEKILGNEPRFGMKDCERQFYETSRRCLVIGSSGICAGEHFKKTHFVVKRGNGILPRDLDQIIGKVAKRDFTADDTLRWGDL